MSVRLLFRASGRMLRSEELRAVPRVPSQPEKRHAAAREDCGRALRSDPPAGSRSRRARAVGFAFCFEAMAGCCRAAALEDCGLCHIVLS